MPTINAKSPGAPDLGSDLAQKDCAFYPFPSCQTRKHLIGPIKRDLLQKVNGLVKYTPYAPFNNNMIKNGFALLANNSWLGQVNHLNHPTDRLTGLEFADLTKPFPQQKSEVLRVTKDEIKNSQEGIKIYCDLEAIKKIYPHYDEELCLRAIQLMMLAKKGNKIGDEEKKVLQKISPHILFRFESKQIFDYYEKNGQEEIKILDPKTDARAQNRPFYFNYTPQLTKGAPDFQYFTYNNTDSLDRKKEEMLKEKYQSMANLQLYVSAKNNEGCFFLEPGAFLDGLSRVEKEKAQKKWLEGVFDAITEFEKRPDGLGKNLGRVFVQSSFLPKDIDRHEPKIKHLHVYFSNRLDCAKTHANLGGGLSVAQPVMGHATHAIGNGALSDGANKAAEENLYRQMAGLMAVVMGPQNNENLLNYNWLASHAENISSGQSLGAKLNLSANSNPQNSGVGGRAGANKAPTGRVSQVSAMSKASQNNSHRAPQSAPQPRPQRPLSASAVEPQNKCCVIS